MQRRIVWLPATDPQQTAVATAAMARILKEHYPLQSGISNLLSPRPSPKPGVTTRRAGPTLGDRPRSTYARRSRSRDAWYLARHRLAHRRRPACLAVRARARHEAHSAPRIRSRKREHFDHAHSIPAIRRAQPPLDTECANRPGSRCPRAARPLVSASFRLVSSLYYCPSGGLIAGAAAGMTASEALIQRGFPPH